MVIKYDPNNPEDVERFRNRVFEYFETREGVVAYDSHGDPRYNKFGDLCYEVPPRPPTMAGLARFLGFATRKSLWDYKNQYPVFREIIEWALLRIEEYSEERLFDREGNRGAEFNLRANFGWKVNDDKPDVEPTRIIDNV